MSFQYCIAEVVNLTCEFYILDAVTICKTLFKTANAGEQTAHRDIPVILCGNLLRQ